MKEIIFIEWKIDGSLEQTQNCHYVIHVASKQYVFRMKNQQWHWNVSGNRAQLFHLPVRINVRPRLNGINEIVSSRTRQSAGWKWRRYDANAAARSKQRRDFDNMWLYLEFPSAQVACLLKIIAKRSGWLNVDGKLAGERRKEISASNVESLAKGATKRNEERTRRVECSGRDRILGERR